MVFGSLERCWIIRLRLWRRCGFPLAFDLMFEGGGAGQSAVAVRPSRPSPALKQHSTTKMESNSNEKTNPEMKGILQYQRKSSRNPDHGRPYKNPPILPPSREGRGSPLPTVIVVVQGVALRKWSTQWTDCDLGPSLVGESKLGEPVVSSSYSLPACGLGELW